MIKKTHAYRDRAGAENGNARISEEDAREIYRLRRPYLGRRLPPDHPSSIQALSKRFRISPANISHICNGTAWRHVKAEMEAARAEP